MIRARGRRPTGGQVRDAIYGGAVPVAFLGGWAGAPWWMAVPLVAIGGAVYAAGRATQRNNDKAFAAARFARLCSEQQARERERWPA